MQNFHTLINEHDHLDGLAAQLMEIARTTRDVGAALAARADLSISLHDHISREDSFIYDRIINTGDTAFAETVAEFRQKFDHLAADWSDYLVLWDSECIAADWDGFAEETLVMMQRLRARIADENRLLYPSALHGNHIRLRPAA